jgi:hypothetical protein
MKIRRPKKKKTQLIYMCVCFPLAKLGHRKSKVWQLTMEFYMIDKLAIYSNEVLLYAAVGFSTRLPK